MNRGGCKSMSEIKNEIILDILDFVFVKIKYLSWLESRMLEDLLSRQ